MPDNEPAKDPEAQVGKEPSPIPPPSIQQTEVVPSSDSSNKKAYDSNYKEEGPKWTDKTMTLFTVALFLAALGQAWIFNKQLGEMHSGGEDTHTLALAAKAQADEAKDQVGKMQEANEKTAGLLAQATAQATETKNLADSALKQANATRDLVDQAVIEGRPWIGLSALITGFAADGKEAKVSFVVSNSGKRPARVTGVRYASHEFLALPSDPPYTVTNEDVAIGSSLIVVPGAGSATDLPIALATTEAKHFALLNTSEPSRLNFFVYGRVDYVDVSYPKTTHRTTVCLVYRPKTSNYPGGFYSCPTYNEAS